MAMTTKAQGSSTAAPEEPEQPSEDAELDPSDPAYWARPQFRIQEPAAPVLHSKLSCLYCKEGTAYSDGRGGYHCFRCGWDS